MLKSDNGVLIITERDDIHGDALMWGLSRAGVRCDRWSISDYPEKQRTSVRISGLSAAPSFAIAGVSGNYQSVWLRRLAQPKALSSSLAAADVPMAHIQARRSSEGIRSIFAPHAVWINPPEVREHADMKPRQLLAARDAGFAIPETLLSNDPEEIRRFYREHNGDVICKFFSPAFWRSRSDGTLSGVFTARLTEQLLADDAAFTSCPAIYQKHLPKRSDVRIVFFGSTYVAVRIWSQRSSSGAVDFRSDIRFEAPMEQMIIEPSLLQRCMELTSKLGLLHGSYDFVEGPDGSFTFLEVNEMGQFLWLEERIPQLPLLSMFVAFSLDPRPEFRFDPGRWPAHSIHDFIRSEVFTAFWNKYANPVASNPFHYPE
jgi:glutathione synthase/RimK-type ligase-like ATP-grasp enzyme